MFENLIYLDYYLFSLMNGQWHCAILDVIVPVWRSQYFWAPLYLFFLAFLLHNYSLKTTAVIVIFLVLTVVVSDQISAGVIKSLLPRMRPCKVPQLIESIRLLVPCGSGKSFVSAHATNHFAVAVLIGNLLKPEFPRLLLILLIWAATIAYGQVYVGVHFPSDVICGAFLGMIIGYLTLRMAKFYIAYRKIALFPS